MAILEKTSPEFSALAAIYASEGLELVSVETLELTPIRTLADLEKALAPFMSEPAKA